MNKKITVNLALAIAIIAMTVTFVITMLLSMNLFDRTVSNVRAKEVMYNKVAEIDKNVRANYYGEINNDSLYDYLCAGYLAGIGDKNATYYTAKQYLELQNIRSGQVIGVGVDVVMDTSGYARVVRCYAGSPAAQAGVEKNWFITKIDENDVKRLSLTQVNSLLRGEEGTTVTLTVLSATGEEQTIELQRRTYDMPSIEYTIPSGKTTGYIQIVNFNSNTAEEVQAAIDAMRASETPINSLVFDVRNTTTGELADVMDVIDLLCPVGPIASQQNKDGSVTVLDTSGSDEVDLPMAVLVNGSTSYTGELFAVSIREFGKGKVVGTQTAGKGTIQCTPVTLSDGSAISYTVGILLDKEGNSFDGTGVTPDVEISLKPDEEANFYSFTVDTDPQITKALEAVTALVSSQSAQSGDAASSSASTPAA